MENLNDTLPGPSRENAAPAITPGWLNLLLADCVREGDNALFLGEGMIGNAGRAMIWTLCEHFGCDDSGVPGQACRVLEWYVADLILNRFRGHDALALWDYLNPRLWLLIGCSFQIAAKATSSTLHVGPNAIKAFLLSVGCYHTVEDVMKTEWDILFRGLDFRVPLYNSVQMGELLAEHIGVQSGTLGLIALTVQLAELRRHDIEAETRAVAGLRRRIRYGNPRVYTLHLAAGCVATALLKASLGEPEGTAQQLATLVRISSAYLEVLRDVILSCITSDLEVELPRPRHRPNILRKNTMHPYARR